jgi:hypothetical protein
MAGFQGLANAKSPLQGLGNLIGGLVTGQRSDPQGMMLQQQEATRTALLRAGVPPPIADAAALNPKILETIAPQLYQKPELKKTGTNPISGQDTMQIWDPIKQTLSPVAGGQGGTSSDVPSDATPQELSAYFNKLAPGSVARAEQMYRGEGSPPNSRMNKLDAAAQQYLLLTHPDWNMTLWTGKNDMQKQLSSSAPNALGGRLTAFRNSFDHLANVSDYVVKKGNADLGVDWLSDKYNQAASRSTAQRDLSANIERRAITYGGERQRALTGSEGTHEDRMAFLKTLGPDTAAQPQQAGTIEGEYAQLKSAMAQEEQKIRERLGEDYLKAHPVVTPDVEKAFTRIEKNIETLRAGKGGKTETPAPASPAGFSIKRIN